MVLLYGYLKTRFLIRERVLSPEISDYYRKKQLERLIKYFGRRIVDVKRNRNTGRKGTI